MARKYLVTAPAPVVSNANSLLVDLGGGLEPLTIDDAQIMGRPEGGSLNSAEPRIFQDRIFSDLVTNVQGSTITQGQAIRYATGADNAVVLAQADSEANAKAFLGGVRDSSIDHNNSGLIQHGGLLRIPAALQEDGPWLRGDQIYLSAATAGRYTKVAPVASLSVVLQVGFCNASPGGGDAFVLLDKQLIEVNP